MPPDCHETLVAQGFRDTRRRSERVGRERVAAAGVAGAVARLEPALALRGRAVREGLRVDAAGRALLDAVVADRGRGVEAVRDVLLGQVLDEAGVDGVRRPHARVAVGLE